MTGTRPPVILTASFGEAFMIIMTLFAIGHLLLGIATYRAHVLPRSVGALLVVGAVSDMLLPRLGAVSPELDALWGIGPVLFGAAIIWLGYALWSGTPSGDAVAHPARRQASTRLATDLR